MGSFEEKELYSLCSSEQKETGQLHESVTSRKGSGGGRRWNNGGSGSAKGGKGGSAGASSEPPEYPLGGGGGGGSTTIPAYCILPSSIFLASLKESLRALLSPSTGSLAMFLLGSGILAPPSIISSFLTIALMSTPLDFGTSLKLPDGLLGDCYSAVLFIFFSRSFSSSIISLAN
ncbi:unnamed protein product [Sphagnum balticum]